MYGVLDLLLYSLVKPRCFDSNIDDMAELECDHGLRQYKNKTWYAVMCYHIRSCETFSFQKKSTIIFCTKTVKQKKLKKLKLNTREWKILYWLYLTLGKEWNFTFILLFWNWIGLF